MKLENWCICAKRMSDAYIAPELVAVRLAGNVANHPAFKDGSHVTTSPIVAFDGDKVKTKSGSLYELGEVDPDYEKVYPNARERLFKSLKG